ncbi:hypothetical protein [Kineococcus aurantiacus]|uniref:Putative MFS family arabinose efflux permease n=1 Tax=Kineococcus aurantiacus TaxID=37633 RepID=A0A7Y9DPU7_9ACTN|nr:hypothetical protein [Kineococcus aurantiacus]NYD24512.1 putative MFS family arabinose efflux permease [Kineococcus aurantiacus]
MAGGRAVPAGVVLCAVGAALPPVVVAASVRARRDVAPQHLTSAFAWLASVSAAGSAAGAALAGRGVDALGAGAAAALAAAALVAVPAVVAVPVLLARGRAGRWGAAR